MKETTEHPERPATLDPGQDRQRFVDVLRGFALLGILVVNMEYIVQHVELGYHAYTSQLDRIIRWLLNTFGQMKMFLLFSVLFGYGLSLQVQRASSRNRPLGPSYMRRMLGLVLLGVLHGVLFFPGDILVIYAFVGCLAYLMRNLNSRLLIWIAAATHLLTSLLWLTLGGLDMLFPELIGETAIEAPALASIGAAVSQHLENWPWTFAALTVLQGPAVFSMFLLGLVLGRTSYLSRPEDHRPLATRVLWCGGTLGLVGSAIGGGLSVQGGASDALGFALAYAFGPLISAAYIAALALWVGSRPGKLARLAEVGGRMSLSIYLLESVVATSLSYGYGAGMFGQVGPLAGTGLSLLIWFLLCAFAMAWLKFARLGPFEWFLRSFTHGRIQPLRS